jgi:galactitol PTS system EIIA component
MGGIVISDKLIEIGIGTAVKAEAIKILADKLKAEGYVRDGYYENVMKREEVFPTGLPSVIPIALCHTEAQYVKQSALAVGTLKKPIEFCEMGTPDNFVKVEMIFLLALNDPKEQIPWLQKMMATFKSKEDLEKIKNASDPKSLAEYLQALFSKTAY